MGRKEVKHLSISNTTSITGKTNKTSSILSAFFTLLIILSLISSSAPLVIAPSHPVELVLDKDGNVIGITDTLDGTTKYHEDTYTLSAGMTPDSPFYFLDGLFESPEEKIGEMDVMITEGNYEAAGVAAEKLLDELHAVEATLEQAATVEEVVQEESTVLSHDAFVEVLKATLVTAVDSGTITPEQAAATGIDEVIEQVTELADAVDEQKDDVIATLAADTGQTELEVEVEVFGAAEEAASVTEVHENEVEEELPVVQTAVTQIETEFEALLAAGDVPNEAAISQLIDEAKVQLESCENAFEHERDGEAFGRLAAAEALLTNVEQLIEVVESPEKFTPEETEEILAELPELQAEMEAEATERIEEASSFVADYEQGITFEDPLITDVYADYAEDMEKVMTLAEKLSTEYQSLYEELIAEGSTPDEATVTLSDSFAQEYRAAYGEPYVPAGMFFTDVPGEGIVPADPELGTVGGGFVEGFEYADASGYKYKMLVDGSGWEYTTPLGETYEQKFPEGYTPPKAYTEGDEVHSYTVQTPEGPVVQTYTATGYEVVKADGSKETFAYPEGTYTFSGGGSSTIKPTGFEIKTEVGGQTKEIKYDYNPEFNTYVSSTGTVFAAHDASLHATQIQYQGDANQYSYTYSGETWNYNPTTSSWTSTTGETYRPEATTFAPIGHEGTGTYTTHSGTWSYDASTNSWTSSTGESHTGYTAGAEPSSYTYSYDSSGSYSYTDPSTGTTYSYSGHEGGTSSPEGGTYTGGEGGGGGGEGGGGGGHDSGGGDSGGGHVVRKILKPLTQQGRSYTAFSVRVFRRF